MTDRLAVYAGARLVGMLTREDEGLSFAYGEAWLADPEAFAISLALPLGRELDPRKARAFFANLLPEAGVRALVCRRLGVSEGNDFGLLEAIGGECAGALTILPEGTAPADRPHDYELLEPKRLRELARSYEALPAVDGRDRVRLSLAGAQDKLPVLLDGGRFYLPVGNSPSTHILKFPNRYFKHLPANEVLVMKLARRVGLRVVDARWECVGPEGLCLVERYDRARDAEGNIVRYHQEDLCQALGVAPTLKYQSEGGPSFVACFDAVRAGTTEPLADAQALLRWLAYSVVVGNADAHAKNVSLLRDDGWRLAPFYDLVSTRAYERIDRRLAMAIGGESDPDRLRRHHFEAQAREVDVRPAWLIDSVLQMADAVLTELTPAVEEAAVLRSPAVERITPAVKKQARRLLRDLRR